MGKRLSYTGMAFRIHTVEGLCIEYQSVRPFVGMGSPHPLRASECCPPSPPGPSGEGRHTLLREWGWGTQFRRRNRKPGTLYTL
jgi:hypothetical protein